jgi:hypothetical protein
MSDYRLYVFDHTGHIRGVTVLNCDSDEEAAAYARSQSDGRPMELWNRDRPIRRFDIEAVRRK